MTEVLVYLLDNICVGFGSRLCGQDIGIPMGTNCTPLVAYLLLFCFERDFVKSLTKEKRYGIIGAFTSTSGDLDDLLCVGSVRFERVVAEYIPLNFNLTKLMLLIPKQPF